MEPLIDAGYHEIITPVNELKRQLLKIEQAGRVAYQSEKHRITYKSADKFIRMIMRRGHESVIEHSNLIVRFNNVSRGFTHEMVRHRLMGYTQESTRYVEPDNFKFIFPPHVDIYEKHLVKIRHKRNLIQQILEFIGVSDRSHMDKEFQLSMFDMADLAESLYASLIDSGMNKEDARQILLIGIKSQITCSGNWREWRHIMKMRTGKPAHWEIRRNMCNLLVDLKTIIPVAFEDFHYGGTDLHGVPYYIMEKR